MPAGVCVWDVGTAVLTCFVFEVLFCIPAGTYVSTQPKADGPAKISPYRAS